MMEEIKKGINDELLGKVKPVMELIKYQDNAVVSKMLINKKNGNVTLFAFDEGEGLSEHTAPFDALIYCIEGKAEVIISRNKNIIDEGQLIIMPSNQTHSIKALSKFKMMLIMIKEIISDVTSYH